jgi:acyl carrier protein
MDTQQKIAEIVRKCANKPAPPEIDEPLFETGYLDSFVLTDLVLELENNFGVHIPDNELNPRRFETVEKIALLVETKAAGSAG